MTRASCIILTACLTCAPATATTLRPLSIEALTLSAERIVVGSVESRESYWSGTRILTRHVVTVEQTWHGPAAEQLNVLTLGGVVGVIGQRVEGTARLRPGDRVLLFLAAGGGADLFIVGMTQGAFHIDEADGLPTLTRPTTGGHLVPGGPSLPTDLTSLRAVVEGLRHDP